MQCFKDIRALVVDDEESTRLLLREALEELGITVTEACDGADAIYKSLLTPFDLVTMDIHMPHVDGLDAIRAMLTVDPGYRIIVISSCRAEKFRAAAREQGVFHFLYKPVKLTELKAAVEEILARLSVAAPWFDVSRTPRPM
jgi:CheY-like chemotaxis protein